MWKRVGLILLFIGSVCFHLTAQQEIYHFFDSRQSKDSLIVIPGMFTTYCQGEQIYWEIPDSLCGRDMIITTTILEAAALKARREEKRYGYSGDLLGPIIICFQKDGNNVLLQIPVCDRIGMDKDKGGIHHVACQRGDLMLHETLPILERTSSSVLVKVTNLLMKSPLFNLHPFNFELTLGMEEMEKSRIEEIKGFPENILIRSKRSFSVEDRSLGANGTFTTSWKIGVCLALLPREPLEMRLRNRNVGYFGLSKVDFSRNAYTPSLISVVKRWRLEPKDPEAYFKGELVEPIKPIVFYIDRNTPSRWVPFFIEAVNAWQESFERIGFKNAIRGELAPTPEENPEFSEDDTRYSFISWKTSFIQNAYGPSTVDPRSGEIITSHVGIFSSVWDLVQQWYFAQCGIVDSLARQIEVPDELLGELIKMVVTHEIGHTLGLEHNFIGSSLYSMEQLRDNEFLDKHGMGTSIMDYMRFNYAARGEDRVSLRNRIARIGTYDHFAIEWGYRYAPEGCVKNLDEWVEKEQRNPEKRFVDMIDVRAQSEDLGNDHVDFNGQGIENLKRLMDMPDVWQVTDQQSYRVVKSRFMGVLHQYSTYIGHVLTDIGGVMRSENDTTRFYVPVSKSYMIKVMQFLDQHVLVPFEWLYRDSLATRVDVDARRLAKDLYESTITRLVQKSINIALIEDNVNEEVYSLDEYLDELHHLIFREWRENTTVSASRYMMQSIYVKALKALFGKPDYIPSRVLVKGMKEVERIVEEGNTYMTGLSDVERKKVTWLLENLKSL